MVFGFDVSGALGVLLLVRKSFASTVCILEDLRLVFGDRK